eukprot:9498276-Pyramimonas_sp.AAC.2
MYPAAFGWHRWSVGRPTLSGGQEGERASGAPLPFCVRRGARERLRIRTTRPLVPPPYAKRQGGAARLLSFLLPS